MNVKINFNDLSVIRELAVLYVVFNASRDEMNSYCLWILIVPFYIMFSMVMWYLDKRNCIVYLHKKRVAFRASPLNKI